MLQYTVKKLFLCAVIMMFGYSSCERNKNEPSPENETLIHAVFFQLKEGLKEASIDSFIVEINKLGALPSVRGLEVATLAQTGDPRLMKEYGCVMYLLFNSKEDLDAYQNDSAHIEIIKRTSKWIGGPPLVHDSYLK